MDDEDLYTQSLKHFTTYTSYPLLRRSPSACHQQMLVCHPLSSVPLSYRQAGLVRTGGSKMVQHFRGNRTFMPVACLAESP
jgi:hypothetical protein